MQLACSQCQHEHKDLYGPYCNLYETGSSHLLKLPLGGKRGHQRMVNKVVCAGWVVENWLDVKHDN